MARVRYRAGFSKSMDYLHGGTPDAAIWTTRSVTHATAMSQSAVPRDRAASVTDDLLPALPGDIRKPTDCVRRSGGVDENWP